MPLDKRDDPSNPSADYTAMLPDWSLIADIRAGYQAIKAAGEKYLPRYEEEGVTDYKRRLACTPWRPEFVDALRNLCSKPFTKEVALQGEPSAEIKAIAEDVDGKGNNLHVFARETFTDGVAAGLGAIYVTYPAAEPAPNRAGDKAAGARPYWVKVKAQDIVALYTVKIGGRDVVQEIRFLESVITPDKFAEKVSNRVRWIRHENGRIVWSLFEKQVVADDQVTWTEIDTGQLIGIDEIPIVLFFTGDRSGNYQVKPPLADLAHMQIEIYHALSREDEILTYAGSPMLKAIGMRPPEPSQSRLEFGPHTTYVEQPSSKITVGPKTVLFAPPTDGVQPDWDFIQPDAANIEAVSKSVQDKIDQFRRLALQPQTPESGRATATSAAIDAAKAHSAIEAWATGLKDALEQAFVFTCRWIKDAETVEVSVHTDFGVDLENADEYANLINMRKMGDLSQRTLWQEGQRRGIFGPQFDPDEEAKQIAEELPGEPSEDELTAALPPKQPDNQENLPTA